MTEESLLSGPLEGPAYGPARPVSLSQTRRPASVRRYLVGQAARDGWVVVAVNFNAAIFLGLVPLTAGYGALDSLILLGVQSTTSIFAATILLFLSFDAERSRVTGMGTFRAAVWLSIGEIAMMLGWGWPAARFLDAGSFETDMLVVLMLTVIGAISAALSGRLPTALAIGRVALFGPTLIWILWARPEGWLLLSALTVFAAGVTMAVGYATYIQHLAQASQSVRLSETRDALRDALTETERARAQALREVAMRERFMHSVTHDLRQPVGALGFYLDDIARKAPEADEAVRAARSCVISANTVIDSVAQIALVADGLPPAVLAPVPLDPLLGRLVVETRALAAHHGLKLRRGRTTLWVLADADRLERTLRNLIHNAIQNTEAGGVLIGARRRGETVTIEVWDTGRGVPPEEREAIFEAFRQGPAARGRALGSVGLGLATVRDFTASMGGTVTLDSRVGAGSRFAVALPRAAPGASAETGPGRLDGRRVLVVDDDPAYAARLVDALRGAGAIAEALTDAAEIRALPEAGFALEGPDRAEALVLDIHLGPGLDGVELHAALGAEAPPTLLVTAALDEATEARARTAGLRVMRKQAPLAAVRIALAALLRDVG